MVVKYRKENTRIFGEKRSADEKLRERAGKRAWKVEKRLEEDRRGELAMKCWEEIKGRSKEKKVGREERFFEDRNVKFDEGG